MAYSSKMNRTARRILGLATAAILAACTSPSSNGSVPSLLSSPGQAGTGPVRATPILFNFTTLDEPYTSFNRLLGINNNSRIVGYTGAGTRTNPSVGYLIYPPYNPNNYRTLEYPSATDTIATSLNNRHAITGYFVDQKLGGTFGFAYVNGLWSAYQDPHARGSGDVTELLGVNDAGIAVGFYRSASGTGSFKMNIGTGKFKAVTVPGASNVIATGINGHGDIIGFLTARSGSTEGFLIKGNSGKVVELSYPGATSTQFLGITIDDRIVGSYVDSLGLTHGFLLLHPLWTSISWQELDDPNGIGTTVATSINLHYDIVGWYVDLSGVTHGFLATPLSY
jgi:hypothetical protein